MSKKIPALFERYKKKNKLIDNWYYESTVKNAIDLIEKATTFDTPSQHDILRMQISEKRLSMQISRQSDSYSDSFYKSNHY